MPVLPKLVTELGRLDLAAATRVSGWMLAVFAITQFFAGPVIGALGDRYGRRPVLIAAMSAFAIDYTVMAVAPTLAWLFLGRAIAGITGATFGPVGAVIADVTPPEKRAANFGLLTAVFGLGFIIGPAVGGLSAGLGDRAPFWCAAGLAAANAAIMSLLLPETLAPENRRAFRLRDAHVIGAFKPLFAAGNASPLLVAWFLWQLGGVVYPTTWAFWCKLRFGWDERAIGWSLAWIGFLQLSVQLALTDRIVRRIGEWGTAVAGLTAGAVALFAYVFVTRGWQVYALFVIAAFGALSWPAMNGILSRMVDATRQGALQGGIGSMNSVAAVAGPIIAAQSLALGAGRGFDGGAFLAAGTLIGLAALIVGFGTPHIRAVHGRPAGPG
jgi:DHA1 family tetracycline resistance protein-like MFS transporter